MCLEGGLAVAVPGGQMTSLVKWFALGTGIGGNFGKFYSMYQFSLLNGKSDFIARCLKPLNFKDICTFSKVYCKFTIIIKIMLALLVFKLSISVFYSISIKKLGFAFHRNIQYLAATFIHDCFRFRSLNWIIIMFILKQLDIFILMVIL